MTFKDQYRATKAMLEANQANRVPFKSEQGVKAVVKLIFTPLTIFIGGILCLKDWMKKKLSK